MMFAMQYMDDLLTAKVWMSKTVCMTIITECACLHKKKRYDWTLRGHDP